MKTGERLSTPSIRQLRTAQERARDFDERSVKQLRMAMPFSPGQRLDQRSRVIREVPPHEPLVHILHNQETLVLSLVITPFATAIHAMDHAHTHQQSSLINVTLQVLSRITIISPAK
jgi:hypothetical protein